MSSGGNVKAALAAVDAQFDEMKRTLAALGLRRINHSVVHEDTPQIRGMVFKIRHLVRVEPA